MTIDKSKQVTLPVWLVSLIISLLATGFTTWGIISSKATSLDVRATHNEQNIKTLQETKVSRDEYKLVIDMLHSIESKLDRHIVESK